MDFLWIFGTHSCFCVASFDGSQNEVCHGLLNDVAVVLRYRAASRGLRGSLTEKGQMPIDSDSHSV